MPDTQPITKNEHDTPYFSWTEALSVNHELIDADHRHIFALANRLHAAIALQSGDAIIGKTLQELIEYTRAHFTREEDYMRAVNFAGFEEHKLEHNFLIHKVINFHCQFMGGREELSVDVLEFLRQWLTQHIMHSDMKIG